MELIHVTRKAPEDIISNMPDNVITNILERLPIQDAVRTGILARNWRFKWNMVSQLVFDVNFCDYLLNTEDNIYEYWSIVNRLLFHLNGAITKFVLRGNLDDGKISHWILFLSRKGIKDLTLDNLDVKPFTLPTHLFSCLELKHLDLSNCFFNPPPSFHGFPNLLSFTLYSGEISELGKFITRCPLLEILKLLSLGRVKLVEIAKLKNLIVLSFVLRDLNSTTIISSYNILELLGSLPKLKELHLNFRDYKLTECGAKKKFPNTFPSLMVLRLTGIDLGSGMNLSCAFELIKRSPNLHTLRISVIQYDANPIPIPEVEYSTRLQNVFFTCFAGSENEMCLIKHLLVCSPFLKRFYICPLVRLAPAEQLMLTTKLLKFPRASTVAEIDFKYSLF